MEDRCYVITFERNLYCTVVHDYEKFNLINQIRPSKARELTVRRSH